MRRMVFLRWFVIALATGPWGFPLSVLSESLGYPSFTGWLVALIGVLLGDLCCFIWWRSLLEDKLCDLPVACEVAMSSSKSSGAKRCADLQP
jgi:uncharacterized membrane protein YdjX (TVP38/TMEM64 family)